MIKINDEKHKIDNGVVHIDKSEVDRMLELQQVKIKCMTELDAAGEFINNEYMISTLDALKIVESNLNTIIDKFIVKINGKS